MDGPPGVACMDTRHPRRLLAPEQVLMRFSIIYDRPSSSLATHPRAIKVRTIPTQYPQLRDDLRDELSVIEHPNRRALRDRNRHGVRSARYGGGSNMAATKPQGQL